MRDIVGKNSAKLAGSKLTIRTDQNRLKLYSVFAANLLAMDTGFVSKTRAHC